MTKGMPAVVFVLVCSAALTGCGESDSPTGPSPAPQAIAAPSPSLGQRDTLAGVSLFGVVYQTTSDGQEPIADATLYCDACGEFGHTWAHTDANGYYSFSGDLAAGGGIWLPAGGRILLNVVRDGYGDPPDLPTPALAPREGGWREVLVNGDTRFDAQPSDSETLSR